MLAFIVTALVANDRVGLTPDNAWLVRRRRGPQLTRKKADVAHHRCSLRSSPPNASRRILERVRTKTDVRELDAYYSPQELAHVREVEWKEVRKEHGKEDSPH